MLDQGAQCSIYFRPCCRLVSCHHTLFSVSKVTRVQPLSKDCQSVRRTRPSSFLDHGHVSYRLHSMCASVIYQLSRQQHPRHSRMTALGSHRLELTSGLKQDPKPCKSKLKSAGRRTPMTPRSRHVPLPDEHSVFHRPYWSAPRNTVCALCAPGRGIRSLSCWLKLDAVDEEADSVHGKVADDGVPVDGKDGDHVGDAQYALETVME
jgi:hypothetical protein